jgi:hypothetical protein
MKPSDIAKKLLYLMAFIVFYIEGLRTFTILMCYILPIGIMILKLCEVMKATNKKSQDTKQKLK